MSLYIVRHALAVPRKRWTGDDDDRPLTARGVAQASVLTSWSRTVGVGSILSSPARRCITTVEGIASALDLPVVAVADLGLSDPPRAIELVGDLLNGTADVVVCTHGEVLWPILRSLRLTSGAGGSQGAAKGSVWILKMLHGRAEATYLTNGALSRLVADLTGSCRSNGRLNPSQAPDDRPRPTIP